MRIFLLDSEIKKVRKYKKDIGSKFKVKLFFEKNNIYTGGEAIEEYTVEQVIKAISMGFDFKTSALLSDPDFLFEEVNIRKYASGKRLHQIKSRIIGTRGKALKTLMQLTDCNIILYENRVALIGPTENVKFALQSLNSIIMGSKHGNVYARLERIMSKPEPDDLGLREFKPAKKKKKQDKN